MARRHHHPQTLAACVEALEPRRLLAAGALDKSFSTDGTTTLDFGSGVKLFATDVASLPDGKTIVVGTAAPSTGTIIQDFALARLNFDGSLDRTFGPNGSGFARTSSGKGKSASAKCVAIQNDGKILVAGNFNDGSGSNFEWAVFRYLTNGSLDTSFNNGGKRTIDFKGEVTDMVVQGDGKIVLVGGHNDAGFLGSPNFNFGIARLNPDGRLDGKFSGDGKAQVGFGGSDIAEAVALDSSGRIVIAGARSPNGLAISRYNTNGSRDTTFGNQGTVLRTFANQSELKVKGMLIQPSGNIVVVGSAGDAANPSSIQFALARFTPAGLLDLTFGADRTGFVKTPFGFASHAVDVIRSFDKGLIVAGSSGGKLALAGYTENGVLNTSFGSAGKVQTNFPVDLRNVGLTQVPGTRRFVAASGTGFQTTRFLDRGANVVSLTHGRLLASEAPAGEPGHTGLLTVNRAESLPVSTRVFFSIGGTARNTNSLNGIDYDLVGMTIRGRDGNITTPFVDIQPGKTAAGFAVLPRDDSTLEPVETAIFSILNNASYEVGDLRTKTIEIADNESVHVNFQTNIATSAGPEFVKDTGQVFGARGNGLNYGWDADNTANARIRNNSRSPDFRYDTHIKMQDGVDRKWEFAVANGFYKVHLVAGDPDFTDSIYKLNLENSSAVSGTPSGTTRWFERTVFVQVNDGRLTLSNAAGSLNNKIAYIDIEAAPIGVSAGVPVTDNIPVDLLSPPIHVNFQPAGSGSAGSGFIASTGLAFGERNGLASGFEVDNSTAAWIRNNPRSPDSRYDTFVRLRDAGVNHTWEIAVPNGLYEVRVVAGDPSATNSVYKISLEGVLALAGTPHDDVRWFRKTVNVQVNDGRLTVANARGARNNKIAFLDIRPAKFGAKPGNVTKDIGVRLLPPPPQVMSGLGASHFRPPVTFSDKSIDEFLLL